MNNGTWEYKSKEKDSLGKIIVNVFFENTKNEKMMGIKINLYRINGVSPQLEYSKITDSNGQVIFDNISHGNYRVIEIINKEIYKKPTYKPWNEVNISNYNKEAIIDVINIKI